MKTRWFNVAIGVGMAILLGVVLSSEAVAKNAVVDTAKVMKEYKKTQQAQERLEKELEDKKDELKKMQSDLEKNRAELEKQEGIVSKKKMDQLKQDFMNKQDGFQEKYREVQSMMVTKQKTLLEGILNDIREVVAQIAKAEKYDLVLDKESILFYEGDDITYKVLDKLNMKSK